MKYSKVWLTPDEVKSLFAIPDLPESYETWLYMLYFPGLRVTEATFVRLMDLDEKAECINIYKGKGRNGELQRVPCEPHVLRRIKRYAEHHDLKDRDYIMFSNKGDQVHRSHVYRVVNQLCEQAKIGKRCGTHTFRRSRAEHLLDSGLELTYVSKFLRHRNLSTTMAYLDISVSDIQRELSKIEMPVIV